MQEMTEAEIYDFMTKDGSSEEAIRKNTQKLRDRVEDERERRVHSLTRLDPDNEERHENEAERIFEEKSRKIDKVLFQIAENAPAKLPLPREKAIEASEKITGSRKSAGTVSRFITGFISVYVSLGLFWLVLFLTFKVLEYFEVSGSRGGLNSLFGMQYMLFILASALAIFVGIGKAVGGE